MQTNHSAYGAAARKIRGSAEHPFHASEAELLRLLQLSAMSCRSSDYCSGWFLWLRLSRSRSGRVLGFIRLLSWSLFLCFLIKYRKAKAACCRHSTQTNCETVYREPSVSDSQANRSMLREASLPFASVCHSASSSWRTERLSADTRRSCSYCC